MKVREVNHGGIAVRNRNVSMQREETYDPFRIEALEGGLPMEPPAAGSTIGYKTIIPYEISAKVLFLADRHPELAEGSVLRPPLQGYGTDPSTSLRFAQDDSAIILGLSQRPPYEITGPSVSMQFVDLERPSNGVAPTSACPKRHWAREGKVRGSLYGIRGCKITSPSSTCGRVYCRDLLGVGVGGEKTDFF